MIIFLSLIKQKQIPERSDSIAEKRRVPQSDMGSTTIDSDAAVSTAAGLFRSQFKSPFSDHICVLSQAKVWPVGLPAHEPLEDEEERRRRDRASEKLKQLEIQMAARVSGSHIVSREPTKGLKSPVSAWSKASKDEV